MLYLIRYQIKIAHKRYSLVGSMQNNVTGQSKVKSGGKVGHIWCALWLNEEITNSV